MKKNKWNISKLKLWKDNPRSIKEKDFNRLKKQIEELGEYKPLLVNSGKNWGEAGTVAGGNMRLRAYREMGKKEIWVSLIHPKSKEEMMKYSLSDNDRAGFYDSDMLANIMPEYDIDWSAFAVDLKEPLTLDGLLPQEIEEDEVPPVEEGEPDSKLGEVYELGRHRLMCGDATKIEDVEKLMDGKKADMILTDPPYGIDLDVSNSDILGGKGKWRNKAKNYSKIIGDDKKYDPTHIFTMFPDVEEVFLWGFDYYAELIPERNDGSVIVWDKRAGVEKMKLTFSEFELCWSKKRHPREVVRITWSGLLGTEQEFDHKRHHPTQKPIALMVWFLNKFSKQDDIVLDLFGGSGSTLIACEQTNRTCYMMELDPKYCDVIRKRYDNYVKKE